MAESSLESRLWSPGVLSTGLILLVAFLANSYFRSRKHLHKKAFDLFDGPLLGEAGSPDFREAMIAGYTKYPGKPFKVPASAHPIVILPLKYINEVKSLPESKLSFNGEVYERFMGEYTGFGALNSTLIHSVKVDLTRNISKTLEMLQDEMKFAAEQNIGPCVDWTPIHVYGRVLRIVALISGRVFVGAPLCRDEEWINISINYTVDSMKAAYMLWTYKPWQRPFVAPIIKEPRLIQKHYTDAKRLLSPIIQGRLHEMKNPDFERPDDMIQWAIENAKERADDILHQADTHLNVSLAAIHTTTMNASHVLYDIAARPEYIAPLREELERVLREDNGKLIKTSMTKLRKLDSIIKESQRFSPVGLVQMHREVRSDIRLADGTVLPKGLFIALPSHNINMDESVWEKPEKFDGFRFEKMRSKPGNENKYQFVTTGADNLNFGHGIHACPGRFFASNEIKVLLTHILLNYDIKLIDGQTRPSNIYQQMTITPDPRARILFKKRTS